MGKQNKEIKVALDISAKIDSASKQIASLKNQIDKFDFSKSLAGEFSKEFKAIENEIIDLQKRLGDSKEINLIDAKAAEKEIDKIEKRWNYLIGKIGKDGFLEKGLKADAQAIRALESIQASYTKGIKEAEATEAKLTKKLEEAKKHQKDLLEIQKSQKTVKASEIEEQKAQLAIIANQEKAAKKARDEAEKALRARVAADKNYSMEQISQKGSPLRKTKEFRAFKEASGAYSTAQTQTKVEKNKLDSMVTKEMQAAEAASAKEAIDKATEALENYRKVSLATAQTDAFSEAKKSLEKIADFKEVDWGSFGIDLSEIKTVEDLEKALVKLRKEADQKASRSLENLGNTVNETSQDFKTMEKEVGDAKDNLEELDERAGQVEAFAERIKQFVGLAGAAQIMSKALRTSFEATKELDAVMTEMAVVTDLKVGDYWEQLPEHTKRASELGVAIRDVYEAETLYYQQGLKTNEVVAMSTETLKMARIAGLSAEDATNKMTAALRGFNMELNETSTQRVADVYSELAAITASDVNEISSAMTKTASIASSAGMEFETTAAFLSQIIETTRESAETAGTALKTVIARFQELKKDPSEIGEVDGEIVDANKIETALRSVGVALRDANGQFRDLDDVFLELSSKWDSLDTNTQRYIATIAAGSRQQSRFIAMMSDFSRTQELVTAANTSAGASNKQYEKTLDSLQSKLEKLKNAWTSFTQGIANSKLIKAGVDLLTKFLTTINKITDAFGDFSGAAKIALLVTALYLGDKAVKVFMTSLTKSKSVFTAMGSVATKTFGTIKEDLRNIKIAMDEFAATASMAKTKMSTVFTPQQSAAMKQYEEALKDLAESERIVAQVEAQYTQYSDEYSYAMFQKSTTTELFNQANARMAAMLGFNGTEQTAYQNLVRAGIATDVAAIAIKNEKTMAILREKGALDEYNNVLDETILKETLKNMTDKADNMNDISEKIGNLGTKLQNLKSTDITKWFTKLGQSFVNLGQGIWNAIVQIAKFIAASAGAIAMIGAAVVAIIGLIHYIKYLQKTSPEGKLKSAEEAADRAAEAADRASEAYKGLVDSLDSLDDKYKGLEELTKGTQEWKKAVQEINSEVLDLIDKYPELSQFYTNVDGVLRVKEGMEDEVQKVMDEAALRSAQAQSMDLAAKQKVLKAQNDVAYKKLSDEAKYGGQDLERWALWSGTAAGAIGGGIGGGFGGAAIGATGMGIGAIPGSVIGAIGGAIAGGIAGGIGAHVGISALQEDNRKTDKEYTEVIAKAIAEGEFNPKNKGEMTKFLQEEFGIAEGPAEHWAEQLVSASGELAEFGEALRQADEQTRMYNEAQAAAALSAINLSSYSEADQAYLQQAASAGAYAAQKTQAEQDVEVQFKDKDEANAIKEEVAKSMYGETAKVKGNKIIYEEDGEEKEIEMSKEEFKAHYAAMEATENMTEALKQVPSIVKDVSRSLGGISAETADAYRQAMQNPEKLTSSQTAALSAVSKSDLTNIFNSLTAEQKKYYGDLEGFIDQWNEKLDDSKKKFENANKLMEQYNINIGKINDNITGDNAVAYAKKLQEMNTVLEGNDEKIALVNSSINSIAQSLTADEFNSFISLWNSFDQSDLGAWEQFEEQLKDMGMEAVLNTEAFKNMTEVTKELRGAVYKVDLNALEDNISKLYKASKDIADKGSRKVDKETYEMLVQIDETLESNFVRLGDEFHYLGGSINDLTKVLNSGIMYELQKTERSIIEQKALYDVIQETNIENIGTRESTKKYDYAEWFHFNAKRLDESNGYGLTDAMVREYYNFGKGREAYIHDGKINIPYKTGVKKQGQDVWNRKDIEITPELAEAIRKKSYDALKKYYETGAAIPGYSDYYYSESRSISANSEGGVENLSTDEQKAYIEHFFENAGEAIINNPELSEAFISHVGDPNAIIGKDLNAMSDEEIKEFASAIFGFVDTIDIDELTKEWKEVQRETAIALMTTNSASVNQDYIARADIQNEEGREMAVRAYKALQTQAQDAGVMSEEQSRRWAELINKLDSGELNDEEEAELAQLRETTVDHLTIIEKQQRGQAAIAAMEERVTEALISQREKEIEKLEDINDSINDANSAIISKIQDQINDTRNARKNQKAEQEIANNQSKLAYLMSDTSGVNSLGAQTLQQDIAEQQENYQDSLIDQEIQKLSDDNAHAAEQRERQIAIMEAALEYDKESGALSRQAEQIVQNSLAQINGGTSPLGTLMGQLLAEEENWGSLTVAAYDVLIAEYIKAAVEAATGWTNINKKTDNTNELIGDLPGQEGIDNTTLNAATGGILSILETEYGKYTEPEKNEKGETVKEGGFSGGGNAQKREDAITGAIAAMKSRGQGLTGFDYSEYAKQYQEAGGTGNFSEILKDRVGQVLTGVIPGAKAPGLGINIGGDTDSTKIELPNGETINGVKVGRKHTNILGKVTEVNKADDTANSYLTTLIGGSPKDGDVGMIEGQPYVYNDGYWRYINSAYDNSGYTELRKALIKSLSTYKTGGLADFTGPAWLDGTKSHPELVLNARDTQNFIQLKDILAEVMNSTSSIGEKQSNGTNGDNYFNIDINVEELKDDYDVDQLADKIRRMLYDDASYRNVNAINLIR